MPRSSNGGETSLPHRPASRISWAIASGHRAARRQRSTTGRPGCDSSRRGASRSERQSGKKLAAAHGELGQWTEARNRLTEWIAASDNVEARVLRARASQQLRDWDAAAQDIGWAQQAEPGNPVVKSFGP